MNNNSISFFIPAYNCEKWIEEAVDSIIQTNFSEGDELIIVNDCSQDNTEQKLLYLINEKYAGKNIKLINHKINMGGGAARNTAVYNSSNNILFCLDSDNVLEQHSILKLKNFMLDNKFDIAAFGEIRFFLDGTQKDATTHSWVYKEPNFTLEDAFKTSKFPGASGNYMFKKKSWKDINGYLMNVSGLDTWSFGIRQLLAGFKMGCLKDTYYFHRHGMSNSYWCTFAQNYNPSLVALSVIFTHIDKFNKKDVNYMLNKGRYTWFENLEQYPIRISIEQTDYLNKKISIKEFIVKLCNFMRGKIRL